MQSDDHKIKTKEPSSKSDDPLMIMKAMASLDNLMGHYLKAHDLMQQMQLAFADKYVKAQIKQLQLQDQDGQRVLFSHIRRAWYEEKAAKGLGFDLKTMIRRQIKLKAPNESYSYASGKVTLDPAMLRMLEHLVNHWEIAKEHNEIQDHIEVDETSIKADVTRVVKKL